MALFFDTEWFDARLRASGLSRAMLATALGITETELNEVWKDQRELRANEVAVLAALLGAQPRDVAHHAGISTPVPKPSQSDPVTVRLHELTERIEQLEAEMRALKAAVASQSDKSA